MAETEAVGAVILFGDGVGLASIMASTPLLPRSAVSRNHPPLAVPIDICYHINHI
ncbi:MAG: hypothetical protein ACM3ZC_00370 [Bacteroidota bacterium]